MLCPISPSLSLFHTYVQLIYKISAWIAFNTHYQRPQNRKDKISEWIDFTFLSVLKGEYILHMHAYVKRPWKKSLKCKQNMCLQKKNEKT